MKKSYLLFLIQSLPRHKDINHTDFLSLNSVEIMTFSVEEISEFGLWHKFNFHIKLSLPYMPKLVYKHTPKITNTEKDFQKYPASH